LRRAGSDNPSGAGNQQERPGHMSDSDKPFKKWLWFPLLALPIIIFLLFVADLVIGFMTSGNR